MIEWGDPAAQLVLAFGIAIALVILAVGKVAAWNRDR